MTLTFVNAPLAIRSPSRFVSQSRSSCPQARRSTPRAAVSHSRAQRPEPANLVVDTAERFRAVACATMDFLNSEMQHHLANYALKFGTHIDDMTIIQDISVSGLDHNGLFLEIVTCDSTGCVCIQEKVSWTSDSGVVDPEQIPDALRKMSVACGLDDSII